MQGKAREEGSPRARAATRRPDESAPSQSPSRYLELGKCFSEGFQVQIAGL